MGRLVWVVASRILAFRERRWATGKAKGSVLVMCKRLLKADSEGFRECRFAKYRDEAETCFYSKWTPNAASFTWLWRCLFPRCLLLCERSNDLCIGPSITTLVHLFYLTVGLPGALALCFPLSPYVCMHYLARIVSSVRQELNLYLLL